MIDYATFSIAVTEHGLVPRDCGRGHWQVTGGACLVNYYPSKGTIYVNGSKGSVKGSIRQAVLAAGAPTPRPLAVGPRPVHGYAYSGSTPTTIIGRMLMMEDRCYWCGCGPLIELTALIDYKLPLTQGGKDTASNNVLACFACQDRRSKTSCSFVPLP